MNYCNTQKVRKKEQRCFMFRVPPRDPGLPKRKAAQEGERRVQHALQGGSSSESQVEGEDNIGPMKKRRTKSRR